MGPLPFIAEDLGVITPAVRALIAETGIPGMDIVQFSDGDVREGYEPKPGTVTFTGTHDNQTLLGFCQSRFGLEGEEAAQMADRIAASVLGSKNDVAIMPLQDVLGLDDAARMNVPGVAEGNWAAGGVGGRRRGSGAPHADGAGLREIPRGQRLGVARGYPRALT